MASKVRKVETPIDGEEKPTVPRELPSYLRYRRAKVVSYACSFLVNVQFFFNVNSEMIQVIDWVNVIFAQSKSSTDVRAVAFPSQVSERCASGPNSSNYNSPTLEIGTGAGALALAHPTRPSQHRSATSGSHCMSLRLPHHITTPRMNPNVQISACESLRANPFARIPR